MCEKHKLLFLPFFVLNDFSILILPPSSNLGISPCSLYVWGMRQSGVRLFLFFYKCYNCTNHS